MNKIEYNIATLRSFFPRKIPLVEWSGTEQSWEFFRDGKNLGGVEAGYE